MGTDCIALLHRLVSHRSLPPCLLCSVLCLSNRFGLRLPLRAGSHILHTTYYTIPLVSFPAPRSAMAISASIHLSDAASSSHVPKLVCRRVSSSSCMTRQVSPLQLMYFKFVCDAVLTAGSSFQIPHLRRPRSSIL